MNVTFLIGNGFDLNLDLKTSYIDFLKRDYLLPNTNDSEIVQAFKQTINDDLVNEPNCWSDAELALGEYTANFNDIANFSECHKSFCVCLHNYLKGLRLPVINNGNRQKVVEILQTGLINFYEKLAYEEVELVADKFTQGQEIEYYFIDFNYTSTLTKFLNLLPHSGESFYEDGAKRPYFINSPYLKIHGEINTPLILGVHNLEQIKNKNFHHDRYVQQSLLKNEMYNALRNGRRKEVCDTLDKSDIICIYGMSLGDTDRYWWNYIVDLLRKNRDRYVIIFIKSKTLETVFVGDIVKEIAEYRRKLFNGRREFQNEFEERVLICRNPLFDFSDIDFSGTEKMEVNTEDVDDYYWGFDNTEQYGRIEKTKRSSFK